jgi:chemotaxis protein histidine kinase CheA
VFLVRDVTSLRRAAQFRIGGQDIEEDRDVIEVI